MYYSETVYLNGKKGMIWYDQYPSNKQPYLQFDNQNKSIIYFYFKLFKAKLSIFKYLKNVNLPY